MTSFWVREYAFNQVKNLIDPAVSSFMKLCLVIENFFRDIQTVDVPAGSAAYEQAKGCN